MLRSFCFRFENSILKQLLIYDHNALDKREQNIVRHYLFGEKIIQDCKQNFARSLTLTIIPRKAKSIVGYTM